eukprot:TRINITY_DN93841_c0_g1_i1.p1 TRINITY_DN93841_c0_g1~~TRINITY_DN93841_c0_g1_i1.p1  ORF type:complete len:500 (+),score=70.11 TRINITY_DN93841_c0_g1_i1:92-1591(+)
MKKRKLVPTLSDAQSLAGWDPSVKDEEVDVEHDPLTGGYYKVSCGKSERAWIGLRGRPGVLRGAYCFEVKVTEGLLRVGWASGSASLTLGSDSEGFGFGGTGKKSHRNKFSDFGSAFEAGDVVTCCIDRSRREISFGVNGSWHGKAFDLPRIWDGVALFPALCARESFKATGYFGCPDHPKVPHGCDFWPLGDAFPEDVCESAAGPPLPPELASVEESTERRSDRADRFTKLARVDQDLKKLSVFQPAHVAVKSGPLVGLSRALERGYLRDAEKLKDPEHIRPLPVLKESLAHALSAGRPWSWEAEMLRSIRQDITIQHADPAFMEEVCEVSALRALANGDWVVFAACASSVKSRPRSRELAWLLLLGCAPIDRAASLQKLKRERDEVACFVRSVLTDMSAGHWTRVLRRTPPSETAAQVFSLVIRPVAAAQALAAITKALPKVQRTVLLRLGIDKLPDAVVIREGIVDGKEAHPHAQSQLRAALRPMQRDDHTSEFIR